MAWAYQLLVVPTLMAAAVYCILVLRLQRNACRSMKVLRELPLLLKARLYSWRGSNKGEERIRSLVRVRRQQRMIAYFQCWPIMTGFFVCSQLLMYISDDCDAAKMLAQYPFAPTHAMIALAGFAAITSPRIFTYRLCLIVEFGAAVFCVVSLTCASNSNPDEFASWRAAFNLLRICSAAVVANTFFTLVTETLTSICLIVAVNWSTLMKSGIIGFQEHFMAMEEDLILILIIAVSWISMSSIRAEARAVLQVKSVRQSEMTARSLLGVMCDAVVSLDSSGCLSSPCPQLSALLLRDSGHGCLQGDQLSDLLDPQDKHALLSKLQENTRNDVPEGQVDLLHVGLTDIYGQTIAVELFLAPMNDEDDNRMHLAGVLEVELARQRGVPEATAEAPSIALAGHHGRDRAESVSSACTDNELHVTFHALSCTIVSCSAGFTFISGPAPEGNSVLEYFKYSKDFERAVVDFVQDGLLEDSDSKEFERHVGVYTMISPTSAKTGIRYMAGCTFMATQDSLESSDPLITLSMEDIAVSISRKHGRGTQSERALRRNGARPASYGRSCTSL